MNQDYNQAWSFINALTGDADNTVIDLRAIHDSNNAVPGHNMRGTLAQCWQAVCSYNAAGYGIFAVIAAMDGQGVKLNNVAWLRANYLDLDSLSAEQNLQLATQSTPAPGFAVNSSPSKWHVYWPVSPYQDNNRFTLIQRKLAQVFQGDKRVADTARVMRLPGTIHLKRPTTPHLVTCHALAGYGHPTTADALEAALAHVNVMEAGGGERHPLGDPSLAAPSVEWLHHTLALTDPNELDRGEWIAFTAAFKQSGWSLLPADQLFAMWSEWCARYASNDPGENLKQWNNLTNTQLGWPSLLHRVPSMRADKLLNRVDRSGEIPQGDPSAPPPPIPSPPPLDCSGPILTDLEQKSWFGGCTYVVNIGEMMTADNRFLNVSQFNVAYGGKRYIIDGEGKTTDEAWKAATRSTLWTVPKVDHIRFVPDVQHGENIMDDMGRVGVNTYKPHNPRRLAGDPSPFLRHVAGILPDARDQRILLDYLAHNVRFPGFKIPWAPVIQSAEGAGKGILKLLMAHAMGRSYTHFPNAKELADSGAKFNGWMRNKTFILADEIKVDDRRDMIEVLKPMISEEMIEVQAKGMDQQLEDNLSNWLFFTNYKDAIPVNRNGRRFSIMFSVMQTADDLLNSQMGEQYFKALYNWLKADGCAIVTDYLLNYPIERGSIPMRAPDTSSTTEAVKLSRSPIERLVHEAVEDGAQGFRGGWISSVALNTRVKASGGMRTPSQATMEAVLQAMGYAWRGRAARSYAQEGDASARANLWSLDPHADPMWYGRAQGWE